MDIVKWEIEKSYDTVLLDDEVRTTRLLNEGWEPFAVEKGQIYFKRSVKNPLHRYGNGYDICPCVNEGQ